MAKDDIRSQVQRFADSILRGTVLAIDPASGGTSLPGWAAYRGGQFLKGGTLPISGGVIQDRLRALYDALQVTDPDVLVIERIRGGNAHEYLHWAVGVTIAATKPLILIEMPVSTWKKHAGKLHKKSDAADAKAIGDCLLDMAKGKVA